MNTMSKEELNNKILEILQQLGNEYYFSLHVGDTNWAHDIKAAYDLEGTIPEEKQRQYISLLVDIVTENAPWERDGLDTGFLVAHATPEQRCRAYVMTMKQSNNDRALPIP